MDVQISLGLHRFGNMMASLIGGEAYLVGSALREGNTDPRDWDVRLRLPNVLFARRYYPRFCSVNHALKGDELEAKAREVCEQFDIQYNCACFDAWYWRWADEMIRMSDKGRLHAGVNVDFQVHPEVCWQRYAKSELPSVRLDTRGQDFSELRLARAEGGGQLS